MPKFQVGDRILIHEKNFPSFNEGLFIGMKKTGTVSKVEPDSILPYEVRMDGFGHHPFWFYEDQLLFEDTAKEAAWFEANKPKPRLPPPKAAGGTA